MRAVHDPNARCGASWSRGREVAICARRAGHAGNHQSQHGVAWNADDGTLTTPADDLEALDPPRPPQASGDAARDRIRQELENLIRGYASAIDGSLEELTGDVPALKGTKVGYVLMLFDFGEDGSFAYASNGERADVVRFLQEARDKVARRTQ